MSPTPSVSTVASCTTTSAQTDANGYAWVKITSQQKGLQYVYAVVDYPENPQHGDATKPLEWGELRYDWALKTWTPGDAESYKVFNAAMAPGNWWRNPVQDYTVPADYGIGAALISRIPTLRDHRRADLRRLRQCARRLEGDL